MVAAVSKYTNITLDRDLYDSYCKNFSSFIELSPSTQLKHELYEVYNQCCEADWNGEDATAISYACYQQAKRFIYFMEALPKAQVTPYPDGTIGFDWKKNGYDVSVVFDNNSYFLYVILSKNFERYGKEFQNDTNQKKFVEMLELLFNEV